MKNQKNYSTQKMYHVDKGGKASTLRHPSQAPDSNVDNDLLDLDENIKEDDEIEKDKSIMELG